MVSPLTAVTLPITLGWTISILAAVLEPSALGMTWTSSPTARSAIAAVARSLVTGVEEVIVKVDAVPDGSVTVIDVLVRAVTTPPGPWAQPWPEPGVGVALSCAPTRACAVLVVVAALATVAPTPSAPRATAVDIPTRFTNFFFVVRYMGGNLSDNTSNVSRWRHLAQPPWEPSREPLRTR